MKKALFILYTFYYLLLSIGVHGTAHECMGRLTEIAWGHEPLSCVCDAFLDDDHEDVDCCDDREVEIWLQEDQLAQKNQHLFEAGIFALPGGFTPFPVASFEVENDLPIGPKALKPPNERLYLAHCSLQFYA
jgi:hypothetical protein